MNLKYVNLTVSFDDGRKLKIFSIVVLLFILQRFLLKQSEYSLSISIANRWKLRAHVLIDK